MPAKENRIRRNSPERHHGAQSGLAVPGGRLYVFEGPDDVGKTTLARMLSKHLSSHGVLSEVLSFPGRESETISELIYRLYHDPQSLGVKSILPVTMQVMVTAAHIEVVEARIKPLLRAGVDVVLDRFWWSTWVYATQDHVPSKTRDLLIDLEMQSWADIRPELLFLVMRHEPLIAQASNERWVELVQLYRQIADLQRPLMPVEAISNDGTLSQTFETIASRVTDQPKS